MPIDASPLRVHGATEGGDLDVAATLRAADGDAAPAYRAHSHEPGVHLLLGGDRDYYVVLSDPPSDSEAQGRLFELLGREVLATFSGRSPVRRKVLELSIVGESEDEVEPPPAATPELAPLAAAPDVGLDLHGALDLTAGVRGAAPLFLLADGALAENPTGGAPEGAACLSTFITAARWISSRRSSTFECLFPPSAFRPDEPRRQERLDATQAARLLVQVRGALAAAAVQDGDSSLDAQAAAQLRAAALTILSHLVATVRKDSSFRAVADGAAATIFDLIDSEKEGERARPALRSHAIQLLQLRAPALSPGDQQHAAALLQTLLRQAPPYDQLPGPWRFAMCSAWDFHEGEVEVLIARYGFKEISPPPGSPTAPGMGQHYRVLQAPFANPSGQPILVYCRTASPRDENLEMGSPDFVGIIINRHAQLGAFDLQAAATQVQQVGYKIMLNSQCAGLTTRFAIAKMFPDADIYSSWDSTYFRTDAKTQKVSASEGIDCFVALLMGMSQSEGHAQLSERMRKAQWFHEQAQHLSGFCQFIGPAHPLVVARYSDVNQDGHADFYDGYLDFALKEIRSDLENSATPRDPGVAASQIGGDAATGLGWAAGSLNRVTQYSDLWRGLPGESALFYIFTAGGFYSQTEPPRDVLTGRDDPYSDIGRLPASCRYNTDSEGGPSNLGVDVMLHSHLSHAAWELKRLLSAADAHRRALDLGFLPASGALATPLGQRGALLLTLAGLLEFPADQNFIDGLWSIALRMLNLPPISRSLVRACITQQDHDASNYYGSLRGLKQLVGDGTSANSGALGKGDPVAFARLASPDATIGRALLLTLPE